MAQDNKMAIHDFGQMIEAKHMALALMDDGVQFAFCPEPISISHPMILKQVQIPPTEGAQP